MTDVGTKLVFEDDQVKVWDFILDPGEAIGMHTHTHDYVYYVVEGSTLEIARKDGTVETAKLVPGDVRRGKNGYTHDARNIGATRFRNVLVELKAG
jgi:mannose-6-phosphate isomerase-like protein (cupin superfamily)